MYCFNHPEIPAVGSCKHCCKGLCLKCASDLGFGLACINLHEQHVTAVSAMVERAVRVQPSGFFGRYASALFFGSLGTLFAVYELTFARKMSGFGIAIGVLFLIYGVYCATAVRKAYSAAKA